MAHGLREQLRHTVGCELIEQHAVRPDVRGVCVVVDTGDALWSQPRHDGQVLRQYTCSNNVTTMHQFSKFLCTILNVGL